MTTARESRDILRALTAEATATAVDLFSRLSGARAARRLVLLDTLPPLVDYYSDGSAALAADFYEESRELAGVRSSFVPELVVVDRTVKLREAVAWATDPLFTDEDPELVPGRLAEVVQINVARPYRDTITSNRRADPAAVGWKRITAGGCRFCRMLADRGAVYKQATANFAAHKSCHCTAAPVFVGGEIGPEASPMQYMASKRNRTPAERERLKDYLDTFYGPA